MNIKHDIQSVHDYNKKLVYSLIHANEGISRQELAAMTKMSPAGITKLVSALLDENLIIEQSYSVKGVGRNPLKLFINPDGITCIGINIDVRRIAAGIIDARGRVVIYEEEPNSVNRRVEDLPDLLCTIVNRLIKQITPKQRESLIGVGVSVPGVVNYPEGEVGFSPQFRWGAFPLRRELERKLDLCVLVDNNIKAVAVYEQIFGIAKDIKDFVVVQIGSGIGGAIVTNGKLYRGENNMTGEFGHILIRTDGAKCDCGRRGCLQAYACISGIEQLAKRKIDKVFRDAHQGDAGCQTILKDAKDYLAVWLANLKNFYNPSLLILYGELLEEYPEFGQDLLDHIEQYSWLGKKGNFKVLCQGIKERQLTVISSAAILMSEYISSDIVILDSAIAN